MVKKYLMGLDLGTNSVGWCVTDENNQIIKKGGKSLWGACLFEEAQDASGRRSARASRRRIQRRAQRIDLLQLLFKEEIDKVDSSFFLRLNNSAYLLEDKDESLRNLSDIDKPFYADKTIYHLRSRLYHSTKKEDIRLIYLAMHHMIKYRGNFLYEGQTFKAKDASKLKEYFDALNQALDINENEELDLSENFEKQYNQTVLPSRGVNQRKERLAALFQPNDGYLKNVVLPLIAGGTVTSIKILELSNDEEKPNPEKLCFADGDFDQKFDEFKKAYCDYPATQVVEICKMIYDYTILGKIIGNNETISEAMIAKYNQHAKDLIVLKKFVKQWDKEVIDPKKKLYNKIFREKLSNNYVAYVGHSESNLGKIDCGHCEQKDFYSFLKKCFGIDKAKKPEDVQNETLRDIFSKMLDRDFLPRLNSTDNGVFPYQLNLMEMDKILKTQSKYYPFLLKKNEVTKEKDGKVLKESVVEGRASTTIDKIESLLTFRIPYYVGPLIPNNGDGDVRGSHSWVVRHDNAQAIYPWNFKQMIDEDKSAEAFIARMLNHCTYLPDKYCLPANSMMYQKYMLLSYLNKIRINGQLISYEQKEDLISKLFLKQATVNKSQIQKFFGGSAVLATAGKNADLEENVPCLSTYSFFEKLFGPAYVKKNESMLEEIVKDMTILNEGSIKERRLINKYHFDPDKDKSVIKAIKNRKFAGWGRLSKELLQLKTKVNNPTGDGKDDKTLLQLMEETNFNLMELINSNQYDFKHQIEEANEVKENISDKKLQHECMLEFINNEYVSPGMKRSIIQTMAIIDDVEKILGKKIDEYYVECTRTSKADKKRTDSRKDQLLKLYEQAKDLAKKDITNLTNTIKNENDLGKFRSDKYYLYLLQMGKSVYTGKPISLSDLNNTNIYDIDHIIPQAFVKDDSLENRVLVEKEINAAKGDHLPLVKNCIAKEGRDLIETLYKKGFMGKKKYENLLRTTDLTKEEKEGFVARQLVYTNQSVKGLADTIRRFKTDNQGNNPDIIFSKAENVSDFRRNYDIVKVRDANHYHHAHDAYLNIWIGRVIDTYFTKRRNEIKSYKIENAFKEGLKDLSGNVVWKGQASIAEIKKNIFNRFDIMVTRMQYIQHGQLWNATIVSKGKAKIPLKLNSPLENTDKYGGKTGITYAFYAYAEYKDKGKLKRNLFAIPLARSNGTDASKTMSYLVNDLGLDVTRLLVPCVRVNSVLYFGKAKAAITGVDHQDKTYYIQNVTELNFGEGELKTIKKIAKLLSLFEKNGLQITPKEDKDLEKIKENFLFNEDRILISPAASEKTKAIVLQNSELDDFLSKLLEKGSSNILNGFSGVKAICQRMESPELKKAYDKLPIWQKAYILREIVMCFGGQSASVDFSLLTTSKESEKKSGGSIGKSTISAALPGITGIYVESPTGFYRKNLLKD